MFFFLKNKKSGFTLIELLVVVAIIGVLASVVLASLNSARSKAKDAAIKAAMTQVANLMALNFNDYGSYCQIQHPGVWVNGQGQTCDSLYTGGYFTGTYGQKARDLCNNIYNNAGRNPGFEFFLIQASPASCADTYSWDVLLNNGKWFCTGSSGAKGEYPDYTSHPGCYNTP